MINILIRQFGGQGEADGLLSDSLCVWVIFGPPAKSSLIKGMFGQAQVMNSCADSKSIHLLQKFIPP